MSTIYQPINSSNELMASNITLTLTGAIAHQQLPLNLRYYNNTMSDVRIDAGSSSEAVIPISAWL
jgi:hypothetical protein